MARLVGVDLPRDKRIEVGLTYVYGIGLTTSRPARSRPAHAHERSHPQGSAQANRRQEEVREQTSGS